MIELRKPVPIGKRANSQCPWCLAFNPIHEYLDQYNDWVSNKPTFGISINPPRHMTKNFQQPLCCKCKKQLQLAIGFQTDHYFKDPQLCILPELKETKS